MGVFNTTTLLSWISSLIFAFFFVVLYTGSKRLSARSYSLIAATCAIWAFSQGMFYFIATGPEAASSGSLLLFFSRLNHFAAASVGPVFFFFSLIFPEERLPRFRVLASLLVFETILAYAYFVHGEVIKEIFPVRADGLQYGWNYGSLGYLFHIHFIPFFFVGIANLYAKYRMATSDEMKGRLTGVIWATALGALAAVIIAIVLPALGEFSFARFAPVAALLWVAFMSYAIFRYRALPVKLIAAEVSVLGLVFILFTNIFLESGKEVALEAVFTGVANTPAGLGLNIYSAIIWVSAIIIASFGLIIYLDSTRKAARAYALVAFLVSAWAAGTGAYLYVSSYEAIMGWAQFNHFLASIIAPAFYYFAYLFPEEKPVARRLSLTLIVPQLLFLPFYLFTNEIIYDSFSVGFRVIDRGLHFGPLAYPFFHLPFLIFFSAGFVHLFKKARRTTNTANRNELYALAFSSLIGVVPAAIVNLILPTFGYFGLYWAGPIGTLIWVILSAYVIVRYHVLSVKLVFAEASVLALGLILFINIFLSESASFGAFGRIIVFGTFSIIGAFFIRSIIRSDEQTETLEKLSLELADLNKNLKQKVGERTREIENTKTHVETIIENLTSGLVEYSNDFTVLRLNRAAERMLGVRREEVVGRQILPHLAEDPKLTTLASVIHRTGTAPNTTSDLTIKQPLELELQIVAAPVAGRLGERTGFIKVLRDITRERLIARSKSEFISIAAHQLRTPLSIIKWTLSVLLEGDKGDLPAAQIESLSRAYTTNERMIGLVNDLLDVARIEDGRFGYDMNKKTVALAVEEAVRSEDALAHGKNITLSLQLPPGETPEQLHDSKKLQVALRGLIDNAIRYTPTGGSVSVSLAYSREEAIITVQDTGIGIPESDRSRLFTKFYRSGGAVRLSPDGSGLGLFIVHHIIKRHGGTIDVQSKENEGTAFIIHLPLNPASIPAGEEKEEYV